MLPEAPRSNDDLTRALDEETRARERAVAEAERQGRLATAFDRLAGAVIAKDDPAALLQELIELFVRSVRADVGVLRLREGNVLRSRSALGLE